ncbi:MAG: hypothetical protein HYX24_00620 [Candidatus Aenigmarchaeota archaeon]|nr:hypothetical protein [Candidatus Aenigmarchaeota archaeon]
MATLIPAEHTQYGGRVMAGCIVSFEAFGKEFISVARLTDKGSRSEKAFLSGNKCSS